MDAVYYKKYEPIFNTWYIKNLLGEGSFGRVFLIERVDFGNTYKSALKAITIPQSQGEIRSVMADGNDEASVKIYFKQIVEEIISEFVLMSKLKGYSNIVSYEDHIIYEHSDGIGWDILIRMELLTPLFSHIHTAKLTRKDIIKLGIDMCRALELCQKYNIIHRDIKPDNIFISENGDYKLGDFGIARTIEKTMGGLSKKGTYQYMAPEIYRGEEYGSSVDLYSLGIVMYRLLNENRTPFLPAHPNPISHNDHESAIMKRISGSIIPAPVNADGRLAEIVLKACAYKITERFSSPMQMREELEAILYNREEAKVIYPGGGDAAIIKSIEYVDTGENAPVKSKTIDTVSLLDDVLNGSTETSASEHSGSNDSLTGGSVNGTHSLFGQKFKNKYDDGTVLEIDAGKTSRRKKSLLIWGVPIIIVIILSFIIGYLWIKNSTKSIPVSSITGIDEKIVLVTGGILQLCPVVEPYNASDQAIKFVSYNDSIAAVNASGKLSALSPGETNIIISAGGINKIINMQVNEQYFPVTEITNVVDAIKMEPGNTMQLEPGIIPENATNKGINFNSLDRLIADINESGKISALNEGETDIIISVDKIEKIIRITVKEPYRPVTDIIGIDNLINLETGKTLQLNPIIEPRDATNAEMTYSCGNNLIAGVDKFGLLTGFSAGDTILTINADNYEKIIRVVVLEPYQAVKEWINEGYEDEPPYKEYERLYIDGNATDEIRYTGNQKPTEPLTTTEPPTTQGSKSRSKNSGSKKPATPTTEASTSAELTLPPIDPNNKPPDIYVDFD